ncbi:hypothetical protein [Bradyrhizobium sp. URHD0069]|uniref:hypothetical protein n=1 Tax=Bradyrhizobium sp. URHD0069 TaxID=1380355 RepID=UPI0004959123|nr:hypothetical protein [Bradyrhizobium sp. URHD0069]
MHAAKTDKTMPVVLSPNPKTKTNSEILGMSKESAFTKALVLIDWEFDAPIPVLRCPITGKVIASGYDPATGEMAEGYGEPKWQEVPTVLFHYIPEVGEFDYIKPELQAKVDSKRKELGEDAEELDDFEILEEHVESLGDVPLVFCLMTSGMACGPVSSSIYVGLDLAAAYRDGSM